MSLVLIPVAMIVGAILGYLASGKYGVNVRNRIYAMEAVFRLWEDHIASDYQRVVEYGLGDFQAIKDRMEAREAAFKAWVAKL